MQKTRLVERIAELLNEKKLPLVADVRDESAEDIRLVIEPRARTVDPELLMESLFKLTELESRIPLNMNVLVKGKVPRVIGLAEALREWLDHRRDVLVRRSNHRLEADRATGWKCSAAILIAYLNLDKVIKIIRNEDEPKPVLMKAFKLTDVQADAILNMRLRNLRKLEEMEIRKEDKELRAEKKTLEKLIQLREGAVEDDRGADQGGARRSSARRRRSASAAPISPRRRSTTRPRSKRRWWCASRSPSWSPRRAGCARCAATSERSVRASRSSRTTSSKFSFFAETTSKVLMFATNGRFYTIEASKLPGGRGHGEPVRLFIDIEQDGDIVTMFPLPGRPQVPGRRAISGRGFVVTEDECLGQHPQGQAGAQRQGAGRGARGRAGRGRAGRARSARTARW